MKYVNIFFIKLYIIIALISIIFTLYLFETYVTFFKDNQKNSITLKEKSFIYNEKTGKKYDTRQKIQIYNNLKKKDPKITVALPPFIFIGKKNNLFPLSGKANSTVINCNELGYYSILKSDRYGFNNPDEEWDKDNIEFLVIGDSFVFGDCVNRPNDISSVLRSLSKKPVLNLGQKGNGPLLEYATLREYLRENVKNIIWVFYENDLINLDYEITSSKLVSYLDDENFSQNLKSKQVTIDGIVESNIEYQFNEGKRAENNLAKNKKLKYKILKFLRLDKTKNIIKTFYFNDDQLLYSRLSKILSNAKKLSLRNDSNFYFVYVPRHQHGKTKYNKKIFKNVKKITNNLEIPFIDIDKLVNEKMDDPRQLYPFGDVGHFNIEGYRKVAETIYNFISD